MAPVDIPPELWLQIFTHLPRGALFSISPVSHQFHALSSPRIFSTFRFHPGIYVERCGGGTSLRWALDRLEFWSSDRIAPHVRACFVALYATSIMTRRRSTDSEPPLGAAVMQAVSRFTNLESLSCNFSFTVELLALCLEGLSQLKTLRLHGGHLAQPADSDPPHPQLKITHFAYTDLRAARASCFAWLDPAALCSLELSPGGPFAIQSLLADKAALAACRNLHTLRITFAASAFTRIHACISAFPALRALTVALTDGVRVDASPLRPLAPHLERYTGPAALLPIVLARAVPEELAVTRGSAAEVLQALRTAERPEWLAALSLNVSLYADILDGAVLRDVLGLCPHLVRLTLDMGSDPGIPLQNPGPPDTALFSRKLVEILRVPSALESVRFRWRLEVYDAQMVSPLPELEAMLRREVPSLKHVSSSGWSPRV
ncbi:hypothetical protein DFH09DRAFT_1406481 [Mycena vulgaris]|nr:hypothetical protein DFH09DRAFT_1406481 [Mycena vulgaris]